MPAKKTTRKRPTKRVSTKRAPARKVTDKDVENYFKAKFKSCGDKKTNKSCSTHCGCSSAIYGLGLIGALVYYIMNATGFWVGVWGVIKAFLWPAFLIFELLKFLGM